MKELNVLLLEDNAADAEVIRNAMKKGGLPADIKLASNKESFLKALETTPIDLVLSDSGVPGYSGMNALEEVHTRHPDLPFLFVSGTADPQRLNEARTAGAFDVIGKSDLGRLPHVVRLSKQFELMQRESTRQKRYAVGWTLLVQTIQDLTGASTVESIFEVVRHAARRLCQCDGATIALAEGDVCHFLDEDVLQPLWKGQRLPLGRTIDGWVMKQRKPVAIADVFADAHVPQELYRPTFIRSMAMVPIRSREPIGTIGIYWARPHQPTADEVDLLQALADITAFAHEGLHLQTGLELRLDERTQDIAAAESDLENVLRWIDLDLGTPLRQVEDVLGRAPAGKAGLREQTLIEVMSNATRQVDARCAAIHAYLQLGRQRLHREPVDLTALVRSLWKDLAAQDGFQVELRLATMPPVNADAAMLRQALTHLLGNARKFSSRQAPAVVEVNSRKDHDETVFAIRDNGIGFDMKNRHRPFVMFERFHPTDVLPGTGAGLAIAQRAIQRHGGRIWAEAKPNEGATFFFTLNGKTQNLSLSTR
ncbi:MAG: ATP-binding protein [Opitutales bacterium]